MPLQRSRTPVVLLEIANLASGTGNGVVLVALPWLVLDLTGSAASAGVVAALSILPALLILPMVGAAIDRFGRRRISVISDVASAVSVIAFPLVGWLWGLDLSWIIVLAIIGAGLDPAGYTARKSLIIDTAKAGRVRLESLNALHEALFASGFTLGPLLGALLISTLGPISAFWIPGALFAVSAVCVQAMKVGDSGREAIEHGADEVSGWRGLTRGLSALGADRALRALTIAIMILAGIYLPTESILLPVYFEGLDSPESLGFVIAALAGGAVVGAFSYGWLSTRMSNYRIIQTAMTGTAIGMVVMAFLPSLWLLALGGALLGLAWGPMEPLLNTLVQQRIPAQEQGRVFGVQMTAFYVFPPVAMLLTGASTERWGVGVIYPAIAAMLVAMTIITLSLQSIRQLNAPVDGASSQ